MAEKRRRIVGFIVFKIEHDYGYIDNINIAGYMQRKAIGRALVSYVEEIAEFAGTKLMKTDTTENTTGVPWKSDQFWVMGFKDTGERMTTEHDFKEIPFVRILK